MLRDNTRDYRDIGLTKQSLLTLLIVLEIYALVLNQGNNSHFVEFKYSIKSILVAFSKKYSVPGTHHRVISHQMDSMLIRWMLDL